MNLKDRIIVALDVHDLEEVKPWVETLSPYVGCFKVGLELATAAGAPQVVKTIHQLGGEVFLDCKFHDIPNTMAGAARSAARLGVKMFNVHASSGEEGMRAAARVKGQSILLAVTVLTSIAEEACHAIYRTSVAERVKDFARQALASGMDGIVCSPQDLEDLYSDPDLRRLITVTPGVRPLWAEAQDQKRVFTPREAVRAGATALVIGRPITHPPRNIGSPVDAVRRILDEIAEGLE